MLNKWSFCHSIAKSCPTLCNSMHWSTQAPLPSTISQSSHQEHFVSPTLVVEHSPAFNYKFKITLVMYDFYLLSYFLFWDEVSNEVKSDTKISANSQNMPWTPVRHQGLKLFLEHQSTKLYRKPLTMHQHNVRKVT